MAFEGKRLRHPGAAASLDGWPGLHVDDRRLLEVIFAAAPLKVLYENTVHAEGTVWDTRNERLLWSDVVNRRVLGWYPDGRVEAVIDRTYFINGNAVLPDGTFVHCEHGRRCLSRSNGRDEPVPWITHYDGKRLNSPNDVAVARDGAVWFTDPTYGIQTPQQGCLAEPELAHRSVYRLDPGNERLARMADFQQPNGLAFSPDGTILYVSDTSRDGGGEKHEIQALSLRDGAAVKKNVLYTAEHGVPDGFTVDRRGWIWTTAGDGVHVIHPDGTHLGLIPTPMTASNCCFGLSDGSRLFIAAKSMLLALDLAAPAL